MSKVTDRLDNQNIVNLARQNYEKQQRLKVPGYIVQLPSKGLIYPQSSPLRSGTIELRHMTAYDEDILTNSSYINNGMVFEKLLDALIVSPDVVSSDIGNPDIEALLISARIYSYGKEYPVTVTDPKTNKQLQRTIDLSKIAYREFNLQSDENGEFEYITEKNKDVIKFKYLTTTEASKITEDHSVSDLMKLTIKSVNGNRDLSAIEDFIKYNFIVSDSKLFRTYLTQNIYGLDFNMEFEGEDGSTFSSRFRIGAELFWV